MFCDDYIFHSTLISLCQNSIILKYAQELVDRSVRYWYLMLVNDDMRLTSALQEHQVIVDCLAAENYEGAVKTLEGHIKAFKDMMYFTA